MDGNIVIVIDQMQTGKRKSKTKIAVKAPHYE